jgi:hypothetical protein
MTDAVLCRVDVKPQQALPNLQKVAAEVHALRESLNQARAEEVKAALAINLIILSLLFTAMRNSRGMEPVSANGGMHGLPSIRDTAYSRRSNADSHNSRTADSALLG